MAQFFNTQRGPIFAVLVDEDKKSRYTIAAYNHGGDGLWAGRTPDERLAAMKRLYLKMVAEYPHSDVDLVKIEPIDAHSIAGGTEPVDQMSRAALEAEVLRLRRKV